jgi:AraC-like DNA-binding protein
MALHSGDDNASDMIFTSCIIRLLVFISQYKVDAITPPKSSVQKAIDYINANIRYDVTIDGVCEYTHTSKYHFCRSFKRATRLTVMEYILKTQIILAKTLLESKTLSIGEISDTCGFSSVSYFCRVFKEHTSQTPLQYKKQK